MDRADLSEAAAGPTRVLVVDDQEVIRGLLAIACSRDPELELVGQVANGEDVVAAVEALRPDVVVLDLGLPDIDGFEVARRVRETGIPVRILILTGRSDAQTIFQARRVADGFLEKTGAIGSIAQFVRAVAEGKPLFSPIQERQAHEALRAHIAHTRRASHVASVLTDREREVLRLLADGLTIRQAARRLFLSERTVETHVGKIYRKLGVRSRVEALSVAASLGLLPAEDVPATG